MNPLARSDIDFIRQTVFNTVDFQYNGEITVQPSDCLRVSCENQVATIGYTNRSDLSRAFFLFAQNYSENKSFSISQKAHFDHCGCMLDASRNGVMKVSAVKQYINCMAALGLNFLMLYTEDTYEVKEYPYFGYMRGRYSKEEIREIDAYAKKLGVEIIPCIQTLGHLAQYLKFGTVTANITDTFHVLLAWEEETYQFIEAEIRAVREMFSTTKIHIGMDEAYDMGRGQFLNKNGYHPSYEILSTHLNRVVELCKKYGFEPMMWNDMFFKNATPDRKYYNYKEAHFSKEVIKNIPDVDMVYWDYYHPDEETYLGMLEKSAELGKKPFFAGGISIWYGFLPSGKLTVDNTVPALRACLKKDIKTVFATMWGDDGTETNAFFSIPYLPYYSEYCYRGLDCTGEDIKKVSQFLTKIPYEVTEAMGSYTYMEEDGIGVFGKNFFYGDLFYELGNFSDRIPKAIETYQAALNTIVKETETAGRNIEWYTYAQMVYEITLEKLKLRQILRKAYQENDKETLLNITNVILPALKERYIAMKKVHKAQWDSIYKPFGFEVITFRYGGTLSRIDDYIETLKNYLDGTIETISELDETPLPAERTGFSSIAGTLFTPSVVF